MRITLIGPPGAGKGTQAVKLASSHGVAHIATGDILRANVKAGTDLGKKAKEYMDSGGLVPDSVIVDMMGSRLQEEDCQRGFILDGFPRTVPQAQALDELLKGLGIALDGAILLDVADDVVVDRLCGRRMCRGCGQIYHNVFNPSSKGDRCDSCDAELYQRDDDKEEVIRQRLAVYHQQTAPLIDYYAAAGSLFRVDGSADGATVLSRLQALVEDMA